MNSIELSLFVNRLQAVAREMGATLRRTSFSPNIRDRLDFSCAIFNENGELCAQAAHIPVHLGSMAYAMREIVNGFEWHAGDMVLVNDPYLGGTHLPDVTLIAPLFTDGRLTAFCANRAHHADIGCPRPGSMPLSRTLAEEGLVISPCYYLREGKLDPQTQQMLSEGLRNPRSTLGDFAAQISANRVGLERLEALSQRLGGSSIGRAFEEVNDYAELLARNTLRDIPNGHYRARDYMDDDGAGTTQVGIEMTVDVVGEQVTVNFSGTSDMVPGNINCPLSVTAAAVYYVFYALMPDATPPCAGTLRPLNIVVPPRCLINACAPAAVAAGNVETSQRIVDVLLAALAEALPERIPAASQGTMNNVAMGGVDWDYYETIGGGCGGHAKGRGLDAAHSHMTNTLNTPVEVLEMNYPLRVRRYAVRYGSNGKGLQPGGNGIVREYEFLEAAAVTILSERRLSSPPGHVGGGAGEPGRNLLNNRRLDGKCEIDVLPGDCLCLETPGGGGWGKR